MTFYCSAEAIIFGPYDIGRIGSWSDAVQLSQWQVLVSNYYKHVRGDRCAFVSALCLVPHLLRSPIGSRFLAIYVPR